MNEVLQNILTRRSIRSFITEKNIPKDILEEIVEAGRFAPTALNRQLTRFTVVQNRQIISELANAIGKALNRENYDFYKPNTIILTSCDRESPFTAVDTACALENMFLYAHSVGIGSVWINQPVVTCDDVEVRKILTKLGIPENHQLGGMAALGYIKTGDSKDLTRKSVVEYFF